jgi:hypothetical protein
MSASDSIGNQIARTWCRSPDDFYECAAAIDAALAEARREGESAMRARAAQWHDQAAFRLRKQGSMGAIGRATFHDGAAEVIRALPLTPSAQGSQG